MTPRDQYLAIARYVCVTKEVTLGNVFARDRRPNVAEARQDIYLILHRRGLTMTQIGRLLGRERTTVRHGIQRAEQRIASKQKTFDFGGLTQ